MIALADLSEAQQKDINYAVMVCRQSRLPLGDIAEEVADRIGIPVADVKAIMSPLVNAIPKGCMYCGQRLDRHGNCHNC